MHKMKTFMQIGLATSEEIQSWAERSFLINGKTYIIGEVKKADTINYRSFKPEKDGLFCERIFGPVKDWICGCGQSRLKTLKNEKKGAGERNSTPQYPYLFPELKFSTKTFDDGESLKYGKEENQEDRGDGIKPASSGIFICPNCQVEVTLSRVRRYRMGYIELGCPVTHIWYLNSRPNIFSVLLKIPTKYVKKITYYRGYSPTVLSSSLEDKKRTTFQQIEKTRSPHSSLGAPGVFGSENPCIAPGGDFFDNEWEFLHIWFSLPRSSKNYSKSSSGVLGVTPAGEFRLVSTIPSWLENTGAKAFKEHFENRNWQKEFEKLQEDLRRTPIFFTETLRSAGEPSLSGGNRSQVGGAEDSGGGTPPRTFGKETLSLANHLVIYENLLKRRKKRVRNLKLLNTLRTAGGNKAFDGFIFQILPVLPPELRPIVQLSAGQFASSDVNDLYRRLISRNNRLKYYFTACGPHLVEFLVRSEQHLVQVAVDALFDGSSAASELGNLRRGSGSLSGNSRGGSNASNAGKTSSSNAGVYKSLSDRIGGKQGRFRQNLLGKRVDYSGRSVIVVGPRLKLHECGLPYEMALELFQAFILRHILELQLAKTIRGAKNLIKLNKPFARQILQNIIEAHPILLNRAPTLHRLGIQAFQPKLISGRAIQLHPLVCTAFNADFDGDQMAVHVPLSPKSRVEARLLMLATTNWLSAATGQPSILPSQDMVLGFYYLTTIQKNAGGRVRNQKAAGTLPSPSSSRKGSSSFQTTSRFSNGKSTSSILGSLYTMTEILQYGPAQRNDLNIHEPIWLTKKDFWPHEQKYFVSQVLAPGKQSWLEMATSTFSQYKYKKDVSPLENFGIPKNQAAFAEKSTPLMKLQNSKNVNRLSFSGIPGGKNSFYEPLVLKIFHSGFANQVYHSYKWTQNTLEERSNKSLRTTAGRVLVNEILEKLSYTGGPAA